MKDFERNLEKKGNLEDNSDKPTRNYCYAIEPWRQITPISEPIRFYPKLYTMATAMYVTTPKDYNNSS